MRQRHPPSTRPASTPAAASVRLLHGDDRFTTLGEGRRTRHAFSFGTHYDPANIAHALLRAHNEDRVAPGSGYPEHPHRDTEVLTWVRSGALRHRDSDGWGGVVPAGGLQRMSAGAGIRHSEWAEGADEPAEVRFVQVWLSPRAGGGRPSYAALDPHQVDAHLDGGGLVPLVSGRDDAAGRLAPLRIGAEATGHLARLPAEDALRLPDGPYLHLFVADGTVELEGAGTLGPGGSARLSEAGPRLVRATGAPAELFCWEMHP